MNLKEWYPCPHHIKGVCWKTSIYCISWLYIFSRERRVHDRPIDSTKVRLHDSTRLDSTRLIHDLISIHDQKVSKTKSISRTPVWVPKLIVYLILSIRIFIVISTRISLLHPREQVFSFQSYFLQRSSYYFNETISGFALMISFHKSSPHNLIQISS